VDLAAPAAAMDRMEAYAFTDSSSGTAVNGYALRYSLLPPSGAHVTGAPVEPFTGDVWLTVQSTYDLADDTHRMTIYTDTVTPLPDRNRTSHILPNHTNGLRVAIDLSDDALLSGQGYERIDPPAANMTLLSDLEWWGGPALLTCLAGGCIGTATLNLIHLRYTDRGDGTAALSFDATAPRRLLYEVTGGDWYYPQPAFVERWSFFVAPVPAPAASWLFLSAFALLGKRLRWRRR
jgi:hypothetical protein